MLLALVLAAACAAPRPPLQAAPPHELGAAELSRRDALFRQAWEPVRGDVLVGVYLRPPAPPSWTARYRLRRSIDPLREVIAIDPSWWQSWWALGKVHERLDEAGEAEQCFASALATAPADVRAEVARDAGRTAAQAGDVPATIHFYESAARADPDDAGITANLAIAHLRAGHVGTAGNLVRDGLRRFPDDPGLRRVLGRVEDAERKSGPCPLPGGACAAANRPAPGPPVVE